ncbi:hypothetical protein OV208_07525 [Corallococcus sp. bb12-1]|uniref:hypothetical protein n=1 Tax=Corallococcus sp. bb12-1 TaxID=2996784 RepID=UPI00226FC72E|nr:hypothetical protein [Corallococcus sp. bb12-1]MCY1041165.1 hypothetical protein [Corallococcus sp. bb12-1]
MLRHRVQLSVLASALWLGACNAPPAPTEEPTPTSEAPRSVRSVESRLSQIELEYEGPTALLEADMEAGNDECDTYNNWCDGTLEVYSFPWTSPQAPTVADAVESVFALRQDDRIPFRFQGNVPFSTMSQQLFFFDALDPHLLTELGNGTEQVQIAYYYASYLVAAGAHDWNHLFIVLYPQSHRVAVFNLVNHET